MVKNTRIYPVPCIDLDKSLTSTIASVMAEVVSAKEPHEVTAPIDQSVGLPAPNGPAGRIIFPYLGIQKSSFINGEWQEWRLKFTARNSSDLPVASMVSDPFRVAAKRGLNFSGEKKPQKKRKKEKQQQKDQGKVQKLNPFMPAVRMMVPKEAMIFKLVDVVIIVDHNAFQFTPYDWQVFFGTRAVNLREVKSTSGLPIEFFQYLTITLQKRRVL